MARLQKEITLPNEGDRRIDPNITAHIINDAVRKLFREVFDSLNIDTGYNYYSIDYYVRARMRSLEGDTHFVEGPFLFVPCIIMNQGIPADRVRFTLDITVVEPDPAAILLFDAMMANFNNGTL